MKAEFLYVLVLFVPAILSQTSTPGKGANCRCLYGQPCWPSEQDFSSLSVQLSQPLIRPLPPASACYPVENPSGNCSEAQLNWTDGSWRADQPGAYQNINFESYTNRNGSISACYLNTTLGLPCEQGSVPPIGVDARTIEDVQVAVRFVGQHNLRLAVKNTGHDYLGRSAARNAFMIWTHHLKNISYNASFIPEGGSNDEAIPALTVGAGVQWREAYAAAEEQHRFILGGLLASTSVGAAGGWVMGGGHSVFSPKYGLGVDNVVQFTIVKANGDHVVANAHRNDDLFWALRGGGAGSWGVVTSVAYRTYDPFPTTMSSINVTFHDPQVAQTVMTEYIGLLPNLSDTGWGGYSNFSNQSLLALFFAPNVSWADTNATILPFFDFVRNTTGQSNVEAFTFPLDNSNTSANSNLGSNMEQVGLIAELASRLMSRDAAEKRPEETAKLLLNFEYAGIDFVAGGAVARANPDSVGLNPGWRKAVALAYTAESWNEGDSGEIVRRARQRVAQDVLRLEPISPDSATYTNEASLYEPDFRKSFFGSHYNKLRSIKHKYDPGSLFLVAEGVGSEDWDDRLICPM